MSVKMEVYGLKFPLIKGNEDLINVILNALSENGLELRDGDIIAIADKIVAAVRGRIVDYDKIRASERAKRLAEKYGLEPGFVELVLSEAEDVYGGIFRALLTLKNGVLIANAGVDHKNVPEGKASLWPESPNREAERIRLEILRRTGKKVGVILVDSRVNPLRRGTVGFAIGFSGIKPVIDCRGKKDLYGKPLRITYMNIVDDLAATAHLIMGETSERIPVVIIRNSPAEVTEEYDLESINVSFDECLYMKNLKPTSSDLAE